MHLLAVVVYFLALVQGLFSGKCPPINVRKDTIIRSRESIRNGAKLLFRTDVESSRECYELCCDRKSCSVAVMHYKKEVDDAGDPTTTKTCFVFACGTPNRCTFMNHTGYAVIEMRPAKKKIEEPMKPKDPIPSEEKCPPGTPVAMCASDPCEKATCPAFTNAHCRPSFCGGCHVAFYNSKGQKLNCETKPKPTESPTNLKHQVEGHARKPVKDSGKAPVKVDVSGDPKKEKDDNERNLKEETVVVGPEDAGAKPTEEPYYPQSDPHAVKEWRTWLNEENHTKNPTTNTITSTDHGQSGTEDMKKSLKKVIVKESPFSMALTISLIICIAILIAVIIKLKCLGPKKKKKFAVDDGDYLINGMYL